MEAKFKRVIIKLSGEALAGEQAFGLESNTLNSLADQIAEISNLGVDVNYVQSNSWFSNYIKEEIALFFGMLFYTKVLKRKELKWKRDLIKL